jgi:uncharacterized LabA/DUF88 family protein
MQQNPLSDKKKCVVYIDGYNWYHAIFKHYPEWKWINVQALFEQMRPREDVVAIKMFSAMVDPDIPQSDARDRQERYFNALKTLPKVKIILGVFQMREVTCRGGCKEKYRVSDEKKTDVNIAVEMISDSLSGQYDHMVVVSGDSDIQPVVEWICKNKPGIKITVYVPALPSNQRDRRTDYYATRGLDVDCKFLPFDTLKDHQLKGAVKLPAGGFAARPHLWVRQGAIPN